MSQIKHDLEAVAEEMRVALMGQLSSIVDGSTARLDGPVREISARMAVAARRQRQDLLDACRDQLQLVLQEAEVEAKASASGALDFLVERGLTLLVNGAIAGLAGLKVTP